jgi:C1A family cysteine protease
LCEYFDARALGKVVVRSPLFLYKMARGLASPMGQPGTDIRTTLKALVNFGAPPEEYFPSDAGHFDVEPDAVVVTLSRRFPPFCYVRLDGRNTSGTTTLDTIRAFLAAGFPSVFGFSVPSSVVLGSHETDIPYREGLESFRGGQAAVVVGYDDYRLTGTRGNLLIYSPLGSTWKMPGLYWLPYHYVEEQLAVDFWTVLRDDWSDSEEFNRPCQGESTTSEESSVDSAHGTDGP